MVAAQQTSLRESATEALTGSSRGSEYEDAAALPTSPPNASVTTIEPFAKSNPYGVAPEDAIVCGSCARPCSSTAKALIEFVPRSVTTSVRPSGLNAICAGSAPGSSERAEPSIGVRLPPSRANPAMPDVPLLST